jgi:uncharacterized membrane protein HdeD (DUF308 family)
MLQLLARRWWALALRGAIAVLFGLLTLFIPGVTLISLVMLFGFYAILDGIPSVFNAAANVQDKHSTRPSDG